MALASNTLLYWFRNDLRLSDNPALRHACAQATRLLPVFCIPPPTETAWGFERVGPHRRALLASALQELQKSLSDAGSGLSIRNGAPADVLPQLMRSVGANAIVCEEIAAPEELAQVAALREAGIVVHTHWQSTMLDPERLPFAPAAMPDQFTNFRRAVETTPPAQHRGQRRARAAHGTTRTEAGSDPVRGRTPVAALRVEPQRSQQHSQQHNLAALSIAPLPRPDFIPPLPENVSLGDLLPVPASGSGGGEASAAAHLARYFSGTLPHTYKTTRDALTGADFSTGFSRWLWSGALSPRTVNDALHTFEELHGATDSSYWIRFELLWRDYFRFLHLKHGAALYRERGLLPYRERGLLLYRERGLLPYRERGLLEAPPASAPHDDEALLRWREGRTGQPLVDAGMRELAATGFLSNRMRQIVASYLIYALECDWRAGAAWFESQLADYDVYTNQGNWLYIAGRGTDPRGGRRFDPAWQMRIHDPDGSYQRQWSAA
jgi:deoxyribodipyrimidine photo-lyase